MAQSQETIDRTAEALSRYTAAVEVLAWLKENGDLKSELPINGLAYLYAVQYGTSDQIKKNLAFLLD